MLKKIGVGLGVLVVLLLVVAGGTFAWAKSASTARLTKKYDVHSVDFPIPFPLSEAELAALRAEKQAADGGVEDALAGVDLAALAKEKAIARGKHLVEARYACSECHGANLGGGVMVDAPPLFVLKGKNLTSGKGGVVGAYTSADWDRLVRHGVKTNGQPTPMPSEDFREMSDRELSDIIVYIQSLPPVDNVVPEPVLGPIGNVLMATGGVRISADHLPHQGEHKVEPPAETSPEFGKHLIAVCVGCHNPDLTGGPVVGGDPSWPPALNLTPHADGLAGWTYEDFVKAMREAKRKNGQDLKQPMAGITKFAKHITEPELKAMWTYLASLPPKPTPKP